MVATPSESLPKQCGTWADLKAAYRLLSHSDEAVTPDAIQAPHRCQTRAACAGHRVILSVQDDSEMAFHFRSHLRGAGKLANGQGQGFIQHTALAVPEAGHMEVQVGQQRDARNRVVQAKRRANVSIRFAQVCLEPPWNHPGSHRPRTTWVVSIREDHPPADTEPVEWMLLTSEPVENLASAQQVIGWYRLRWVIEEWHRVEKEGCRVQASQLDDVRDMQRLLAIVGVIAVRLLQLRDLAGLREGDEEKSPKLLPEGGADDPETLAAMVPAVWITVVAGLAKTAIEQLTPRQFWLTIARRGGWLGRRSDGRPGWKVVWRGWYDVSLMAEGAERHAAANKPPQRSG